MFEPRTALAIALSLIAAPIICQAQTPKAEAVHGLTGQEYQKWVAAMGGSRMRVAQVSVHSVNGQPVFSAIATGDYEKWLAKHFMTAAQFQQSSDDMKNDNFRLTSISPYSEKGINLYAATWLLNSDRRTWLARHGLTSSEYQKFYDDAARQGLRPISIAGSQEGSSHRISAVFLKPHDRFASIAFHDLKQTDYKRNIEKFRPQGYYPQVIAGYASGSETKYALVLVRDPRMQWIERHDLSAGEYQQAFDEHARNGFMVSQVCGYSKSGQSRYAGVWTKPLASLANLPKSGAAVPALASLDQVMQEFMHSRSIPSATLAVHKDGKIIYARGFGWLDANKTKVTPANATYRLASVTKPLTSAVVHKLVREGKLKWDDRAFELLHIKNSVESRFANITIQQLNEHKGGWDRNRLNTNPFHRGQVFDPMFEPIEIANALRRKSPATAQDVIDFMATQPLQFDPGSRSSYSNFGFCVLGRVIEKVTGKPYVEYLQTAILHPVGANSIRLGASLVEGRLPLEPFYSDPGLGRNVFDPKGSTVPVADGGFHLEAMDSHGGLIGSAPDLCKFLGAYWIDGRVRNGGSANYTFNGSLPGTWTYVSQLPNGVSYAVLFNQRRDPSGLRYADIKKNLDAAINGISKWP